jgi:predicted nucleic acid-binding protein
MVLVDTSIWVDHLRRGLPELVAQLHAGTVVCHPFVLGELACGNLKNRREILELLGTLCTCPFATHEEALDFIESNHLMGLGLGYVDVHLLACARLSGLSLWTRDRALKSAATRLQVAWPAR